MVDLVARLLIIYQDTFVRAALDYNPYQKGCEVMVNLGFQT